MNKINKTIITFDLANIPACYKTARDNEDTFTSRYYNNKEILINVTNGKQQFPLLNDQTIRFTLGKALYSGLKGDITRAIKLFILESIVNSKTTWCYISTGYSYNIKPAVTLTQMYVDNGSYSARIGLNVRTGISVIEHRVGQENKIDDREILKCLVSMQSRVKLLTKSIIKANQQADKIIKLWQKK